MGGLDSVRKENEMESGEQREKRKGKGGKQTEGMEN